MLKGRLWDIHTSVGYEVVWGRGRFQEEVHPAFMHRLVLTALDGRRKEIITRPICYFMHLNGKVCSQRDADAISQ